MGALQGTRALRKGSLDVAEAKVTENDKLVDGSIDPPLAAESLEQARSEKEKAAAALKTLEEGALADFAELMEHGPSIPLPPQETGTEEAVTGDQPTETAGDES